MIQFGDSIYVASGVFAKMAMEMHGEAVFVDETTLNKEGVEDFIKSL